MSTLQAKDRIIVALDVNDAEKMESIVQLLGGQVGAFKIGLEAIYSLGAQQAIDIVHRNGGRVFLDGKLHDIPNTIGGAMQAISKMNVYMTNVHASSGREALQAATAAKGDTLALAVTVLTSIGDAESMEIYNTQAKQKVIRFANMAADTGMDGVICSPKEVEIIRRHPDLNNLLLVTPGVRPEWAETGDQKRFLTPCDAMAAGSDYLVIGRPILRPPSDFSMMEAVQLIAKEIGQGLKKRGLAKIYGGNPGGV